jgi:hypothetical protein
MMPGILFCLTIKKPFIPLECKSLIISTGNSNPIPSGLTVLLGPLIIVLNLFLLNLNTPLVLDRVFLLIQYVDVGIDSFFLDL